MHPQHQQRGGFPNKAHKKKDGMGIEQRYHPIFLYTPNPRQILRIEPMTPQNEETRPVCQVRHTNGTIMNE